MQPPLAAAVRAVLDVAFPPACAACGAVTADRLDPDRGFCHACEADLPLLDGEICCRCGSPLVAPTEDPDCPLCRGERWAFDEVVALGAYDGLLRRLVLDAKHAPGEAAAMALGRMLATRRRDRLAAFDGACVTPIPQHWRRRLARRADGVGAFARAIAAELSLPLKRCLRRVRATPRQTEVAPSDRRANVRGAFAASFRWTAPPATVVLVDDVFTTGATCDAAARGLRRAGVGRVVTVVAARRLERP